MLYAAHPAAQALSSFVFSLCHNQIGNNCQQDLQDHKADHNLTVAVGPWTGFIPREEAALGIAEGTTRDIAILSRVGKSVACVVTGMEEWEDGSLRPILSRRLAQEQAAR